MYLKLIFKFLHQLYPNTYICLQYYRLLTVTNEELKLFIQIKIIYRDFCAIKKTLLAKAWWLE